MDTSELRSLSVLLTEEADRLTEMRASAKEQQRKVLRVNCEMDLKRVAKVEMWLEHIHKDPRRTW